MTKSPSLITHDEIIAKLEAAIKPVSSFDPSLVIHAHEFHEIIRAHKPAPVDLEKIVNVIAALYTDWGTRTRRQPSPREIAKAVIQALGREVL